MEVVVEHLFFERLKIANRYPPCVCCIIGSSQFRQRWVIEREVERVADRAPTLTARRMVEYATVYGLLGRWRQG